MEWKAKNRMNRMMPMSIVAILFSLATLAQRISFAPKPVRFFVLAILRRADPVAYSYVYWTARDCGAPLFWYSPMTGQRGSSPEDALDLAAWFRVLAVALRDLPRQALLSKSRSAIRVGSGAQDADPLRASRFALELARRTLRIPAPDTS